MKFIGDKLEYRRLCLYWHVSGMSPTCINQCCHIENWMIEYTGLFTNWTLFRIQIYIKNWLSDYFPISSDSKMLICYRETWASWDSNARGILATLDRGYKSITFIDQFIGSLSLLVRYWTIHGRLSVLWWLVADVANSTEQTISSIHFCCRIRF